MNRRRSQGPTSSATPRVKAGQSYLLVALLIAGTLLAYAQAWNLGFMFIDDADYVSENRPVQEGITLGSLKWSFTTVHDCNWIPLTWLSLMLDADLYGVRPGGYHLTNVLLHAASVVVLFLALLSATRNRARSAFVAALFALHPLHVESVAWIAERKDVLSTLFGMLSLLTYVRYARGAARWCLGTSFLFFVCSLLSKQTLVTLPFVFLLLDFWPLGRLRLAGKSWLPSAQPAPPGGDVGPSAPECHDRLISDRRRAALRPVAEKIPFFAASVAFSAIATLAQSQGAVRTLEQFPLAARCMNAIVVYVAYLWKAVYPHDLAVFYPYPQAGFSWFVVGFSAAALLSITAAAIAGLRRYPFLLVGWLWYLGTLVPVIGLVQIGLQQMADRYTYFPLIGIFLAIAWLVPELVPAGVLRTWVLPAAAVASVMLLGAATFTQIGYWRDNVTLLRHSKDCTPDNLLAHQYLGSALVLEDAANGGDVTEGVAELETAVRMGPRSADTHYRLATGLQKLGRFDEAAQQYRTALAIDDRLPNAHTNLGLLLLKHRKYDEAMRHYLRALEIDETFVNAHVNLAFLCLTMGDNAAAIAHAERALELHPPQPPACHVCIGLALRGQGRLDEAIHRLRYAVELSPNDEIAKRELARTLQMKRGSSRS
jgi:tetratricopeptide (TPR) repeat protein